MKVAIFDFDGTLYKKETFTLLMNHLKEHPVYAARYKRFYRTIVVPYFSYKLKMYPAEKMKANLMHKYLKVFKGRSKAEVDTYFAGVAQEMMADMNQAVITRMSEHAREGYYTMIVSGAYTPLLEVIAEDLPVDHIIATEVPFKDGVFDTKASMDHVHATRKTELIRKFFGVQEIDWRSSVAYGDSFSDVPVLEMVGKPVAAYPDEKLRQVAGEKSWEILDE